MASEPDPFFVVPTPLGFIVRTTHQYWPRLLAKHPDLASRVLALQHALASPDEVRRSRRDPHVLLFYRRDDPYWLVAVVRRLNGDGFLITAYRTDTIKEGKRLWPR
jgi:hypothetical protein